jgi:hypothetical protein
MMIKNPEIHDAYVKLEMEDEFLGALERVIRDLYCESRISSPYPIDFVPDIKVINSYMTMRHNDIQTAKEELVRQDLMLRDKCIINTDDLEKLVGELPK